MTDSLLSVAEKKAPSGWMWSSIALRLTDGTSVVFSPTRRLPEAAHEAITAVGRPSILLAPNDRHFLGLAEFRDRYPGSVCVCSERARPRLTAKSGQTYLGLDALRALLPAGTTLVEPPGTRNGEVWLVTDGPDGPIWVVCDAFFNVPRTPKGSIGFFCRLTGTAPGLRISLTWKYLAVKDRVAYADWLLLRLNESPPATLIPCHGQPLGGPALGGILRTMVEKRFL